MPEPGEEPVPVVTAPPPPAVTDVTDLPVEGGGAEDPDPGE
jgi:hypothetical protein